MKKIVLTLLFVVASLAMALPVWSQVVSNPNDRIYTDLKLWADEGLISRLPPLRPYPIQLVTQYLKEVERAGTAADRKRAAAYLDAIDHRFKGSITPSALVRVGIGSGGRTHFEQAGLIGTIQGTLTPSVTYSARLGAYAMSNSATPGPLQPGQPDTTFSLPLYQRPAQDVINDVSVNELPFIHLTPRLSMDSQTALGSSTAYFEAGLMRDSFGPFWGDSVVLSPTAPQSGNLSFTWREGFFTYTALLLAISATNNDGSGGPQPDKYLSLQSLEFYPTSWLSLGILDSVVWGTNLNPLYMLPVPTVFFYSSGTVGYPGAAHVGLSAGIKLPQSLRADFLLYQGDTSFNDIIRLHFNTMLIFAGQAGLSWTPDMRFLKRLSLGYTVVSPYSYTHENASSGLNYENYTNNGQNMATSLDPNSDRIQIKALVRPLPSTDVTLFGRYIRHANASYDIPNMPASANGTVFDDGTNSSGTLTYTPGSGYSQLFRFLTQPVIEKVIQVGFDAKAYLDSPIGRIDGEIGYTFQYVMNALDANGNPQSGVNATNSYVTVGAGISF